MGRINGKGETGMVGYATPIDLKGDVATFHGGTAGVAFRLGVDQAEKLRDCDDLRRNTVNLYCAAWTPTKIPMWGHISQLCLNVKTSDRNGHPSKPTIRQITNNARWLRNTDNLQWSPSATQQPPIGWHPIRKNFYSDRPPRCYITIASPFLYRF